MRNFIVVGITGATGSGKSTITKYLERKGCYIIDADELGRKVLDKGSICLKQVCIKFGDDILNTDGTLNRQLLAKKAFSNKDNTQTLNNITHPYIFMEILKKIDNIRETKENSIIILDAAVLLESKMDILCDYVISIIAPVNVRLERIMKRDNITKENAKMRINVQNNDKFYTDKSDFVINGNDEIGKIYKKADDILKQICKR